MAADIARRAGPPHTTRRLRSRCPTAFSRSSRRLTDSWRAVRAVAADEQLRRAVSAFAWAVCGEWAFTVALGVVAFRDGGASGVGAVAVLRLVPSAVGTPFITGLAERVRRERALAVVSAIRVVTIGAASLVLASGLSHVVFYALVVPATVAFTVFRPTHSSLLPLLCTTTAQLASANVVRGLLESLATLGGPVLAGSLLAVSGPPAAVAAAAVSSLAAAAMLIRIRYDAPVRSAPSERMGALRNAGAGLRAVGDSRDLRWLFGMGFAQTYTRGALNVFIVVMAFRLLDMGDPGVAALSAAVGLGGIFGSLGVSLLVGSRHLGVWLVAALALWGAPIAIVGGFPVSSVAYPLVAVVGFANAIIDVPLFTMPVRLVRDEVLAGVFGLFESVIAVGVAVGSALTPGAIELLGLQGAMIATGLVLPLVAVAAWRPMASLDAHLAVRDTEIGVLRRTPMLALLPVPSIEYLASRIEIRTVAAGTEVVAQGDTGTSFFVIADGTADVIGDGIVLRTIGPTECFGEIALLEHVARTASVRARDDLVVLEIGRDAFVEAITGHSPTNDAARDIVAGHLADFHPTMMGI